MILSTHQKLLKKTALFIVFLLFLLSFASIKLWDFDFWFHISTGRYIVEKNEIPSHDVFSFVTEENRGRFSGTDLREKFIMRAYWLSQVIFFYIFTLFGSWGIVLLRSLLLTMVLVLVYAGLRRSGSPALFSLSLLIPVFYVLLTKYTGDRPVLFTFVLSLLVFLIIEDYLKAKNRWILFLPFIMLAWSNLHGGYMLGVAFISVYLMVEGFRYLLKKSTLSKDKFYLFVSLLTVSIVFSFINPNGLTIFSMFSSKYNVFHTNIQEYQPLFDFYAKNVVRMNYNVLFIVLITILTVLLRSVQMRLEHIILIVGLFVESLSHQRFFVFSATIGIIIVGNELTAFYRYLTSKYDFFQKDIFRKIATSTMIIFLMFFSGKTAFALKENLRSVSSVHIVDTPKGAVDFIEKNNLQGRMFNTDAIGGYAIWRLYPGKQVFADTRLLDIATLTEFDNIMSANSIDVGGKPLWEKLIDMYSINFVVTNPLDAYGNLVPLVSALVENERWTLVYVDINYFIFLKNNEGNNQLIDKFRIARNDTYWHIINLVSSKALNNADNPFFFKTIGEYFLRLKDYEEAEKAFKHVLRIDPGNQAALKTLSRINNMKADEKAHRTE